MARPKKDAAAPAAATPQGTTIPISEFQRTRDSVVTGLVTLQKSINELMTAYVSHCDKIVGGGTSNSLDISNFLNNISSEPVVLETKPRRKRAKKEKDPNAPKRPLTAYFLYSQHARDIIKNDLKRANDGNDPKSQEVQDEATKRWNNMSADEKKGWTDTYNQNYEQYKREVADYQEKKKQAALEAGASEADALAAAAVESESEHEIPAPKATTAAAKAASTKAAAVKKPRKNAKAANGVTASPAPAAGKAVATPIPLPSDKGSEAKAAVGKKRKAPAKEKETPAKAADDEPKKKKPRKSKAAEEPAAEPEAKPADKKKRKRKSEAATS